VKDTKAKIAEAQATYRKAVKQAGEALRKATAEANDAYVKAVNDATVRRNSALEKAARDNAKAVENINKTYSTRLADIVRQSIDRLRNAYSSAVAVDVGRLFGEESVGKNVDKLIANLRTKLEQSRRLIANTSELAARGFSQTFIEQVVSAGTETGNELAQAILEATPETQEELKSLFGAIESQAETGMDALSQEIYDKAGLATNALKKLYKDTQGELAQSLSDQAGLYAEQQAEILTEFQDALTNAKLARDKAIQDANKAYTDAIKAAFDAYKEDLDKIEKEYKDKLDSIGSLSTALQKQAAQLQSQIATAGSFNPGLASPVGDLNKATAASAAAQKPAPSNNINVNVKIDPTQNAAQVGKKIATTVQRYTASGGSAGGSAMPWQIL
jgi:phage-related protein